MKYSKKILQKHNILPIYQFTIPSKSEPGKYHIVKGYKSGTWECDCVGFLMRPYQDCRHIKIAKELLKQYLTKKYGQKKQKK